MNEKGINKDQNPTESLEAEIKLTPTLEGQAKFRGDKDKKFLLEQLSILLKFGNLKVIDKYEVINEDMYLDTEDRALLHGRHCCRVRTQGGVSVLEFKRDKGREAGYYERLESCPVKIPTEKLNEVIKSNGFSDHFNDIRRQFESLSDKPLVPVVGLRNARTVLKIACADQLFECALDEFVITFPKGDDQKLHFELEIEAKNDQAQSRIKDMHSTLPLLIKFLEKSTSSKYELAANIVDRQRGSRSKRKGWWTRTANIIAALFSIVASIAALTSAYISCSRNTTTLAGQPEKGGSRLKQSTKPKPPQSDQSDSSR